MLKSKSSIESRVREMLKTGIKDNKSKGKKGDAKKKECPTLHLVTPKQGKSHKKYDHSWQEILELFFHAQDLSMSSTTENFDTKA